MIVKDYLKDFENISVSKITNQFLECEVIEMVNSGKYRVLLLEEPKAKINKFDKIEVVTLRVMNNGTLKVVYDNRYYCLEDYNRDITK